MHTTFFACDTCFSLQIKKAQKCTYTSSLGAQQKSHAQFAEITFLQDDVDSVFQFSFDRLVSLVQSPLLPHSSLLHEKKGPWSIELENSGEPAASERGGLLSTFRSLSKAR